MKKAVLARMDYETMGSLARGGKGPPPFLHRKKDKQTENNTCSRFAGEPELSNSQTHKNDSVMLFVVILHLLVVIFNFFVVTVSFCRFFFLFASLCAFGVFCVSSKYLCECVASPCSCFKSLCGHF